MTTSRVAASASLFVVLLLAGSVASAQQRDSRKAIIDTLRVRTTEAHLKSLEAKWNDAHITGDTAELKRQWADDITFVIPGMPTFTKDEVMALWRAGRAKVARHETFDVTVRPYGDSAIVEGRLRRQRDFNGRVIEDHWRFSKTFMRRDGTWRVVRYRASLAPVSMTAVLVDIAGSDYAFLGSPATLPPGETLFSFENRGKVRHELAIALLKPGVTVEDGMRAATQPGFRRLVELSIGLLVVAPGDTSGGRIYVKLLPGRSYAVVCTLRDTPESPPHVMLGMVAGFTVPERREP